MNLIRSGVAMSLSMVLKETMSGWIQLEGKQKAVFSFEIEAISKKLLSITSPRPFIGTAIYGTDEQKIPIQGQLIIHLNGPEYDFNMNINSVGDVRIAGKKKYQLRQLKNSLTTCPLEVDKDGRVIGNASVAYRQPLWRFPFEAISLTSK